MEKGGVDLRRLRYFIAVCDHGGFSRASSAVGIAQPSLTRQIKLLERELGVALFHRTGRGAGPTTEGQLLLDRSRPHLDGIDEAVRQLRQLSSKLSGNVAGEVTLGICPTIAPLFLEDLRRRLEALHPSIRMTVVEAYSGDLASMMAHGSIDVSLTYSPSDTRNVRFTELFSEPLVLVTPHGQGGGKRPQTFEQIGRHRLILPSAMHELRRIIDAVSASRGVRLEPDIELDSLGAVKSMLLASGTGHATILPLNSVGGEIADRRLSAHAIADPRMRRTIAIVVPAHGRNTAATDAVSALMQARADGLVATRQNGGGGLTGDLIAASGAQGYSP